MTASEAASPPGAPGRRQRRGARVTPLYHQVYVQLRDALLTGTLDPTTALPSEPMLAERYQVSRVTIRRTLAKLVEEGLIRRVRGVGTFPAGVGKPDESDERPANISGYLESLLSYEEKTEARNLSWETVVPEPGPVRDALGSAPCLRVVRLRSYRGRPISLSTLHVPDPHDALIDASRPDSVPLIHLLEEAGIVAERTEQTISAVRAGAMAGDALGVAHDAPLISMRRLMVDMEGAPVIHHVSLYAPDQFEYRMTLTRTTVGPVARWTPIS